jgi:hypothetical protein
MLNKSKYYYSASTRGFYTNSIHGDNIPEDALIITAELHQELLAGQGSGQQIMAPDEEHALPWLGEPTPREETAADLLAGITARLKAIDEESSRPMRAIIGGWAIEKDSAILADLEKEAEGLRQELKTLRSVEGQKSQTED